MVANPGTTLMLSETAGVGYRDPHPDNTLDIDIMKSTARTYAHNVRKGGRLHEKPDLAVFYR